MNKDFGIKVVAISNCYNFDGGGVIVGWPSQRCVRNFSRASLELDEVSRQPLHSRASNPTPALHLVPRNFVS